jgi:hypothetical protein
VGVCGGVLSVKGARTFFAELVESERPADISSTIAIDRPSFALKYPGNWKVRIDDADYDPDHMVSIDSPGESFVLVVVAVGALDPATSVRSHVTLQTSKLIQGATNTPFTHWGAFAGSGALLSGKYMGITPGSMRIFSWRSGEQTFTIIESTYDDDRARVAPGFSLIERTFTVKKD